jgi:Ferritin-like domain
MEISEQQVRALVRGVDEEHREGMAGLPERIDEIHRGSGRRLLTPPRPGTLLATSLVAGALTIPLASAYAAYAADGGDGGVAAFAESVELAAVEAYKAAAASGKVTVRAVLDAATTFAGHHQEHAAAFGAAAGAAATKKPNPKLLAAVGAQLAAATDQAAVLKVAFDLENAAAATYVFALGALTSTAALQLTASILPVEAQHAVVLGQVLGLPATAFLPSFETATAAVTPDMFPIS